jgi:hypothetical protein
LVANGEIARFQRVIVIDLAPSLLAVAKERTTRLALKQRFDCDVELICGDCLDESVVRRLPARGADLITFSYSLSMMPDHVYQRAVELYAGRLNADGGLLGIVDFTSGAGSQNSLVAAFWRQWFSFDGVRLDTSRYAFLTAGLWRRVESEASLELDRNAKFPNLHSAKHAAAASSAPHWNDSLQVAYHRLTDAYLMVAPFTVQHFAIVYQNKQ